MIGTSERDGRRREGTLLAFLRCTHPWQSRKRVQTTALRHKDRRRDNYKKQGDQASLEREPSAFVRHGTS